MLSIVNEFDKVPVNAGMQAIAMAHIDAPPRAAANGEKRKPVNISAVIDISGSMNDGKLELVKTTLEYVLRELNGEDNLGVVAFDDRVEEAVPLRPMSADNKEAALRAIKAMAPRGSTNLSGGLFGGMAQICGDAVDVAEHDEMKRVVRTQRAMPTRNRAPSLLDRVKSTLGLSSSHADPNQRDTNAPASDASSGVSAFSLTAKVSHDYVSVKKDEAKVHQYFMAVALGAVPCGLTCEVTIGGASVTLKDGKYEHTVECAKGPAEFVDVRIVVKKGGKAVAEKLIKHACGVSEDGEETVEISGGSKTSTPRECGVGAQLNTIWLFTDGQANCGITDPAELSRTVQSRLQASKKDMTVFTFGFGRSHNASMLQAIAEVSQGSYYFIEDQPAIAGAFADCLGGLLSVVAQNVVLTIEPADERVKIEKVMTKYPTKQDGKKHVVTMKDLYGEEKRDILVLTSLPGVGNASRLATVKFSLQFVEAVSGRTLTEGADAVVEVTTEVVTLTPNAEVDKQRNRIKVTEAMEEAKTLADGGRLNDAREKLKVCEAAVKSSGTSNDAFVGHLLDDLCRVQASCATESMYASAGQKCLNQAYSSHAQQRSNVESGAYVTSAKKSMRSKFL